MFNNKKIMGITIAGIMVLTLAVGSAYAEGTNGQKQLAVSPKTSESTQTADKGIPSHEDLVKLADQCSIDITGMTDEQIEKALKAFKLSHKNEAAVKSDKGGKEEGTYSHESLVETAKECGIDVTGMTDEQIGAALDAFKQSHEGESAKGVTSHESLAETAKECDINTTGMTDEQIEEALKAFKLNNTSK